MAKSVIEVKNLVKHYGPADSGFTAVNDISFSVKEGEVVGFLGPNGAGKTTTIQMLLGITSLTSGTITYFGKNFQTHREESLQRINFASAFNTLQGRMSVMENLLVFARLYSVQNPKKKIMELIEYFKSEDLLNKTYYNMSAGQKTRINIIKSLLNDPDILLLDEPTASLDPDVADTTLSLIQDLKKSRNISLLFTSHNMDEITKICDRVIFLDNGSIVAEDSPLNLTKKITNAKLIVSFDGKSKTVEEYLTNEKQKYSFSNKFTVVIETQEKLIPGLIFGLSKNDIWITDIEIKKPTLEDFFLHIARGRLEKGENNVI
jgi:ABC-2 type transport system ATP-binding protein